MSEWKRVAIIGAGIAGPALALALRRAGIESVVYEASPRPRDHAGAFINLAPNGVTMLEELGLRDRVHEFGFVNDRMVYHNEAGKVLADVAAGGITLRRGDLSRLLREHALESGIQFEFGRRLLAVQQHGSSISARFIDGTAVAGPVLIGADGVHSRTRNSFLSEMPKAQYTGIVTLGGIATTQLPSTAGATHMIFGRRAFFGYAVPRPGETWWFSNISEPEEPPRGSLDELDHVRWRERLLEIHRDDPAEVAHILRAVTGNLGAYAVYEIDPLPRWHRGLVCLIGDAAHAVGPHVGQGAALALEDAFELARCLRDIRDPVSAFTAFEDLRRKRVLRVLRQSHRIVRQSVPRGAMSRTLRDLVMPLFLRRGQSATKWMYSWQPAWHDRIPSFRRRQWRSVM